MIGWKFAFSRKWLGYLGVAVVFAIICVGLSHWQWDRRAENLVVEQRLSANFHAKPVDLALVLPTRTSYDPKNEYQPVRMVGSYLTGKTLLARDRTYNGYPGFEVLVPFKTTAGTVFIVDRGWVPSGNLHDAPDSIPAPPRGRVTVVARLSPSEPLIKTRTDPPRSNQVAVIHLTDVQNKIGLPIYTKAFGELKSESPSVAVKPSPYLEPATNEGLNLSYAVQWILFALAAFAFFGYVIRQEYNTLNSDEEDQRWLEEVREYRDARRKPDDKMIEDELLDEFGYEGSVPGDRISR